MDAMLLAFLYLDSLPCILDMDVSCCWHGCESCAEPNFDGIEKLDRQL